jgi:hypothetical protein
MMPLDEQLAGFRQAGLRRPAANRRGGEVKILLALETVENWGESKASRSIGRTYQDDSERSSRRKANEAETGEQEIPGGLRS